MTVSSLLSIKSVELLNSARFSANDTSKPCLFVNSKDCNVTSSTSGLELTYLWEIPISFITKVVISNMTSNSFVANLN